jgi:AcrR family transcriptional regulator
MIERFVDEDVRTRLILAGITELEERGARDFSLRRAAESAGVSCAAPYRYFKSKEEYVSEIFSYLASKWNLMFSEIKTAYRGEGERLVTELSLAYIRFWLANKNLRSALLFSGEVGGVRISDFDSGIKSASSELFEKRGVASQSAEEKSNALSALLLGYVALIGTGELTYDERTMETVRSFISSFLNA